MTSISSSFSSMFNGSISQSGGSGSSNVTKYIDFDKLKTIVQNGGSIEDYMKQIGLSISELPQEAVQKLLTELMSMLGGSFDFNQEATEEVKRNNERIQKAAEDIDLTRRTGNEKIDEVLEKIENNVCKVETSIGNLQELEGEVSEVIESYKEEIEQEQEKAQEQVKILNSKDSKTEDKRNALRAISDINDNVLNLADALDAMVLNYNTRIAAEDTAVMSATKEIATDSQTAIGTIQETLTSINQKGLKGTKEGLTNITKTAASGAKDVTVGSVGEAAAGAMESNMFTAQAGAKLMTTSTEKITAGGTKLGGVGTGLTEIGSMLQRKGSAYADVSKWTTILGEFDTKASARITAYGDLSASIMPSIQSIGSITSNLTAEVATVETSIEQYAQNNKTEFEQYEQNNRTEYVTKYDPKKDDKKPTNTWDYISSSNANTNTNSIYNIGQIGNQGEQNKQGTEFKAPEYKKCFETSALNK